MPFSELKCMENINTSCQKVNVYSHCTFYMIALFSFSRLAEKKYFIICDCILYLPGEKAIMLLLMILHKMQDRC